MECVTPGLRSHLVHPRAVWPEPGSLPQGLGKDGRGPRCFMPGWPVCSKGVGEVSIQTTPAGDKIRPQLILVLPDAGKSQEAVSAGGSGAGPPPALPCPAGGEHTLG